MKYKKEYKNIGETMQYLLSQVNDSKKFADNWLPGNMGEGDTQYLWELLKGNTVYVNDPADTELLQSMRSLMQGEYWGVKGAGDCDCFVITTTACCIVLNIPCKIVLAGRTSEKPVHIYNLVHNGREWIAFDLTNGYLGEERHYPIKQIINLK